MDLLIASGALAANAQLAANNKKHFCFVPDLKIADWF
jgi:predicted nucleic acid-binding protein